MNNVLAVAALAFAAISSMAALASAVFVYWQVQKLSEQSRISAFMKFQDRFAEDDFNHSIQVLYHFKERHGDKFPEKFVEEFNAESETGLEINSARRRMNNYFMSLTEAIKIGALNTKLARAVTTSSSRKAFLTICVPMNELLYGKPWGARYTECISDLDFPENH